MWFIVALLLTVLFNSKHLDEWDVGQKVIKNIGGSSLIKTEGGSTLLNTWPTLREESSQTNVILQYKLLAAILSAVCSVIQPS